MALIDISSYKLDLIKDLIASETILTGIDSQQADIHSPDDYIYKNIYPFAYLPDTETKSDTFILFFVDLPNINRQNPTFADIRLTIWVLVHKDRQQMKEQNASRADYLGEEIRKMLDGSKNYGYGVLDLVASREVILNEKYVYRELIFRTVDMKMSSHNKVGRFS